MKLNATMPSGANFHYVNDDEDEAAEKLLEQLLADWDDEKALDRARETAAANGLLSSNAARNDAVGQLGSSRTARDAILAAALAWREAGAVNRTTRARASRRPRPGAAVRIA